MPWWRRTGRGGRIVAAWPPGWGAVGGEAGARVPARRRHHAGVGEARRGGGDRGLLAAVLGGAGGEDRTDLADETPFRPEAAGLVEEVLHLRRHGAVAGRRAEDDGVVVRKLLDSGD